MNLLLALLLVALCLLEHPTARELGFADQLRFFEDSMSLNPDCIGVGCGIGVSCHCDYSCKEYGDCCPAIVLDILRNSTDPRDLFSPIPKRWQCARIPTVLGTRWVYMVSRCPSEWQDDQVALRCARSDRLTAYTHILDVPAFSGSSKTLYANIYCAVCNGDTGSIHSTELSFNCDFNIRRCPSRLDNSSYVAGELRWQVGNVTVSATLEGPPYARWCQPYADHCDDTRSSNTVYRNLCQLYRNPVDVSFLDYPHSAGIYKNIHCAACDGILTNESECVPKTRILSVKPEYSFRPPSFSLLIDFHGGGNVGTEAACATGQLYDTVSRTCVSYFCGSLYKMNTDGQCVPEVTTPNTTDIGLENPCLKVVILQSEYAYLNESAIRINKTDDERILEKGSFEPSYNGSVLVCAPDTLVSETDKFSAVQGILSSVCLILSLSCLTVHILVYGSLAKLRNLPGKNLLSLSCSIFVAQLLFFVGINLKKPRVVCTAIGATTHLSYLASFFWMNVMAFDMCRTFTSKSVHRHSTAQQSRTFARYATYAWMWPCLLVSTCLILDGTFAIPDLRPRYAEPLCWFNSRTSLAVFLALPLLVLLVENLIFFTLTALAIKRATAEAAFAVRGSKRSDKTRFFLYLKLAFLVGFTWIFGFVAVLSDLDPFWYLFIILNSLQGTFIFFAFTFKRNILSMVLDKFPRLPLAPRNKKEIPEPSTTITSFRTTDTQVIN